MRHIWIGYDHIAFLILLLLPAVLVSRSGSAGDGESTWEPAARWTGVAGTVLRMVTAFTVAHSITFSLAALGFVVPPERPVEIGIAASVIVAGIVNLYPRVATRGTLLAFAFGLLHGFGFANVLRELDLTSTSSGLAAGRIQSWRRDRSAHDRAAALAYHLCSAAIAPVSAPHRPRDVNHGRGPGRRLADAAFGLKRTCGSS